MCVDYCAGLRWRAGRRSGPQPILHTLGALHSGHGRRLVPEPAVHAEIPQTGNAASACFEGKDIGSGSAWRRSLKEGRLDPIATKSGKSQRNHAISALPFLRPVRKSIES